MKVLTVTNMWPIQNSPYYGIFVKEQVEALNKYFPEITNRVYFINGKKSKLNYLWSIIRLNWLITFNKYDAIHIHYALSGIFLLFNPFLKQKKVIITLHGSDFNSQNGFNQKLIARILSKATDIIFLNKRMESSLEKFKKKLHHIPCGVDTELFKPELNKPSTKVIKIAFPASKKRPEKNYPFFQKVMLELEKNFNYKIEVIEIHGKSRLEVNTILNEVDLICMTSFTEGSPQIIKEAMCCNTPIVSSNVGDVKDILTEVENTFIIEDFDLIAFSEAINSILEQPKPLRFTNGREVIQQLGLDDKNTSSKLLKAYETDIN